MATAVTARHVANLPQDGVRQMGGLVHRFPLEHAKQFNSRVGVLDRQVGPADQVCIILLFRQKRRFLVRRGVREREDRDTVCLDGWRGVGMKRDKNIRLLVARQLDPLAKFQVTVIGPRQDRPDQAGAAELLGKLQRGGKRDLFFQRFRPADGAGILTAMPGIDKYRPFGFRCRGCLLYTSPSPRD